MPLTITPDHPDDTECTDFTVGGLPVGVPLWITVGDMSLAVVRDASGYKVAAYPLQAEDAESVGEFCVPDDALAVPVEG